MTVIGRLDQKSAQWHLLPLLHSLSMSEDPDSDGYEYYIVHDGLGISHVIRRKKGVDPSIECADCD